MKRKITVLFASALLMLFVSTALYAWNFRTHELIAKHTARVLPLPLRIFYTGSIVSFSRMSVQPDLDKEYDPEEHYNHYINIDNLEKYPFSGFPLTFNGAVDKYGEDSALETGLLPFAIYETKEKLKNDFKKGSTSGALRHSGYLCHYVADACMPLHVTANYNGQLTDQYGVHSNYESRMIDANLKQIIPGQNIKVEQIPEEAFRKYIMDVIVTSYDNAAPVLAADKKARAADPLVGDRYIEVLFAETERITGQSIDRAVKTTADIIYTAWKEAGSPYMTPADNSESGETPEPSQKKSILSMIVPGALTVALIIGVIIMFFQYKSGRDDIGP